MKSDWLDSLKDAHAEWDELATACPSSHPQYLFDWVEPWWRLIGSKQHTLRVLRVENNGRTAGLAPLMLVRRNVRNLITLRELRWLGSGASDQNDIFSREDAVDVGRTVGARLVEEKRAWDELHLDCVPAGSQAVEAMLDTVRGGLRCTVFTRTAPSYFIDTRSCDWEQYLATTSKKFVRRDLPRVRRRLAELGEVTISRHHTIDVGKLMDTAAAVHQARQKELRRSSGLADSAYRAFVTDCLAAFGRRDLLSAWVMKVGADIAAYLIGFEFGRVFYAWNMAHNPVYDLASPGKVLWASAIQGCFEDTAIDEFNMMRGDTEYKLKWTATSRDLLDIRIRNLDTTKSALLNRLRRPIG